MSRMNADTLETCLLTWCQRVFPEVVKVVQKLENTVYVTVHRATSPTMYGSDLKLVRIPEHGECSDPWSGL